MGSEILGILGILRAGYVSGILWVRRSDELEILRAGDVSGIWRVRESSES